MTKREILVNQIQTPDGFMLKSKSPIECDVYIDTFNRKKYIVSGGIDAVERYGANDYIEKTIYKDDPIEEVRESFTWGSYGRQETEPLHFIKLKDLTTEHIDNIILTQTHVPKSIIDIFIAELDYRTHND